MTDLADFLLARVAEDENDARGSRTFTPLSVVTCACGRSGHISGGNWAEPHSVYVQHDDGTQHELAHDEGKRVWGQLSVADGAKRTLAESEAKRRIIELHGRREHQADFDRWDHTERRMHYWNADACSQCGHPDVWPVEWPCETLRLLALPYADHPDYREEWTV